MKKIFVIVGTRPNFIKITQFKKYGAQFGFDIRVVHTGQHYDYKMAQVFFDQFKLEPDYFLEIPKSTQIDQIAEVMKRLEKLFTDEQPDLVLVPGDVNSTFAAAFAANRMGITVGHIESGLRSFDPAMPEEINRVLTDRITDMYFVTEQSGLDHLTTEGVPEEKIHFVGNTMIDTMCAFEQEIEESPIIDQLQLEGSPFILMTMHRPRNVDQQNQIDKLIALLGRLSERYRVVFPVHPRTRKLLEDAFEQAENLSSDRIHLVEPMDYFSFQKLIKYTDVIITDSGGIQEESTFRQVPCLTLRPNTERPVTIDIGTNTLLPFDLDLVDSYLKKIESGEYKQGQIPPQWDGHATERILEAIQAQLS
ncbi:UDP-N-acetylglucosamine 2-epimerase (non-hydrolyzing) [bacterium SCSIO 12741]|nr:UDP-N-acetylglucosamine 2-epimerase (non-hydrolyzing) [bacterium SCSIO 12741]